MPLTGRVASAKRALMRFEVFVAACLDYYQSSSGKHYRTRMHRGAVRKITYLRILMAMGAQIPPAGAMVTVGPDGI